LNNCKDRSRHHNFSTVSGQPAKDTKYSSVYNGAVAASFSYRLG